MGTAEDLKQKQWGLREFRIKRYISISGYFHCPLPMKLALYVDQSTYPKDIIMELIAESVSWKMEFRRNLLLKNIFRNGPIGRLELSRNLKMSKSRLCEVILEMIDEGLIVEDLRGSERRGRNPVPLSTNPDYGSFVGIDFEAQRMRLVVVNFSGEILYKKQQPLHPEMDSGRLIKKLLRFIESGMKTAESSNANVLGIGVAAPGITHRSTGTLVHYDLIPSIKNIPIRNLVENRTGLPCVVDNNIRCYALTEWTHGAAQGMDNFICLAVRSGFGSAIVLNGSLLDGSHGFSGEAGYVAVPSEKPASKWKTLQEIVSEKALQVAPDTNLATLPKAKVQKAGELVGAQAASMAALLDPEAIILIGALLEKDSPLWPVVYETYDRFILSDIADIVPLVHSEVGSYAAAVGATQRCFQEIYPTSINSYHG